MADLTMTVEHTIMAPQQAVFDAWLDPDMLRKFMRPDSRVTIPTLQIDPKVGGRFDILMRMSGVSSRGTAPHPPKTARLHPISPHTTAAPM
jgi:uncharacterized protein YndB with AHSA1/START domain